MPHHAAARLLTRSLERGARFLSRLAVATGKTVLVCRSDETGTAAKFKKAIPVLIGLGALGFGATIPLGYSAPSCHAKHGVCDTTSTTGQTSTSTTTTTTASTPTATTTTATTTTTPTTATTPTTTTTATTPTTTTTTTTTPTTTTTTTTTSSNVDPSGVPMSTGDVTADGVAWHQVFADNFPASENVALGAYCGDPAGFPHASQVSARWNAYPYTWTSTWTKSGTANAMGKWANDCPERVDSIHDGMLDIWLHSETDRNAGALNELTHDVPKINGSSNSLTYGRVSVRYKQPMSFVGYHYAWLFWPNDSAHANYCDGEMDFPEMNTDSSTISAFAHWANATSCSQADGYSTNIPAVGAWHTETVEWSPSFVKFYLDGNTVGSDTNTAHIASWAEHWVLQFDAGASTLPSNLGSGHIYIDWVTIYARA